MMSMEKREGAGEPAAGCRVRIPRQCLRPIFAPRSADVRRCHDHRAGVRGKQGRRFRLAPPFWRRLVLLLLILGTAGWMICSFFGMVSANGLNILELLQLGVFAVLSTWLAQSFWTLVAGALLIGRACRRPPAPVAPAAPHGGRVALVMPIYKEDPERVFAGVRGIWQELSRHPVFARCDLHVLSDTTDPGIAAAEERQLARLRSRADAAERIFYRRRAENVGRKTGNIEEFLTRCGNEYAYFLVLDADSLMEPATIAELVARMDADPDLGLVQVPPKLVRGRTLFARMLQFAGELYGPLAAAGTAFWSGDGGNYWGHNAIIRTHAFMAHCGLPELPGRAPFGGAILSHDFVEAALLQRAGYKVRIAWDLGGSFEEPPPTLEEFLARDRRWCQGNLQHLRIVAARGLRSASRIHLLIGIFSYLTSPLWLLFLMLSVARAISDSRTALSLEPDPWPLLMVTLGLLLAPKLFALLLALSDPVRRGGAGGTARLMVSFLLENFHAAAQAPVLMLYHTGFVFSILAGAAVEWRPQPRELPRDARTRLVRRFGWCSLTGLVLLVLSGLAVSWNLSLWLAPVLVGMALALPLALLTSSVRAGSLLRRWQLLSTLEERRPPPVLEALEEILGRATPASPEEEGGSEEILPIPAAA